MIRSRMFLFCVNVRMKARDVCEIDNEVVIVP